MQLGRRPTRSVLAVQGAQARLESVASPKVLPGAKIPTIFERDWNGDRSRVLDEINPAAAWVFAGKGWPTIKLDGTCCLVRRGKLYKRRQVRIDQVSTVPGFELADIDDVTGKAVGWILIGDGPEDQWHREAFARHSEWRDGTYELCGPKIQSNAENWKEHGLLAHRVWSLVVRGGVDGNSPFERTFEGIRAWLADWPFEGIVFHHEDGRMAKIKGLDFGIDRKEVAARQRALSQQPQAPLDISNFPFEIFESGPPPQPPTKWIDPYAGGTAPSMKPPTDLSFGAARRKLKRGH